MNSTILANQSSDFMVFIIARILEYIYLNDAKSVPGICYSLK